MMLAVVSVFAQQQETKTDVKYNQYLTNGFWDNWFIGVGGGAQVYFGEHDGAIDLGDRIAPAFDITLGKWITPLFGVRGQFAGIGVKGGMVQNRGHFIEEAYDGCANCYTEKFNMFNLHGDFLWNISKALSEFFEPEKIVHSLRNCFEKYFGCNNLEVYIIIRLNLLFLYN